MPSLRPICLLVMLMLGCAPRPHDAPLPDVGQLLIVGFRGITPATSTRIAADIRDLHLGGIILFDVDAPTGTRPRNIVNATQVRELVADLRAQSAAPLLVAADVEGGRVNRFKPASGFLDAPSARDLGLQNDPERTFEVATGLARELAELGVNVNFAPVVDVDINPANPVIGGLGRSYSSDPERVIAHAAAFIRAHRDQGILTAIKHFPGHGSSATDTHLGLTDVTATYQPLELEPFAALIRLGLTDMVMTSHVMNRSVDPDYPVTLSEYCINPILRRQLGYDGVVVSDDMQMGAIVQHYSLREALIRAVNAGCDMLILSNNGREFDPDIAARAVDVLRDAVQREEIPRSRVDEALRRIQALQRRLPHSEMAPFVRCGG